MKSGHRHELKTNELAEWILNFPAWAKQNARMVIYYALAIILVLGAYIYYSYNKEVLVPQKHAEFTDLLNKLSTSKMQLLQAQGEDYSATLLQLADEFQSAAQNAGDDKQAALALIKRGQVLRMKLHYQLKPSTGEEIATGINLAKTSYSEALTKAGNDSTLTAAAKLGLGLCEEELGNFDQAAQIYRDITTNALFKSTVESSLAAKRLDVLDDYKQNVTFKEPTQSPNDIKSQIQLAPIDFNLSN